MKKSNFLTVSFSGWQMSWALLSLLCLSGLLLLPLSRSAAQTASLKNDGSLSPGTLIVKVTGFNTTKANCASCFMTVRKPLTMIVVSNKPRRLSATVRLRRCCTTCPSVHLASQSFTT